MDSQFDEYVRKPFPIGAFEITEENLEDVARQIGIVRTAANGQRYIEVDRTKIPGVVKVFPGFWMTTMIGGNLRCYSRRTFLAQFTPMTDEWKALLEDPQDLHTL